jgi:hypothetical protein
MHVFAHREKAGAQCVSFPVPIAMTKRSPACGTVGDPAPGSPTIGLARTTSPMAKATKPGGTASETK